MPEQIRPEKAFYNSYGNYTHYRFQDFSAGCEHRSEQRSCVHADNELGPIDAECLCDFCPLVEAAFQREDPSEPDYDPTDWSEGEQPILILSDALRERLFGAPTAGGTPKQRREAARG